LSSLLTGIVGGTIGAAITFLFNSIESAEGAKRDRFNMLRKEVSKISKNCASMKNLPDKNHSKSEFQNQCEASLSMINLLLVEEGVSAQGRTKELVEDFMLKAESCIGYKEKERNVLTPYYESEKELHLHIAQLIKDANRSNIRKIYEKTKI
jgi:hypothetical protein